MLRPYNDKGMLRPCDGDGRWRGAGARQLAHSS